jgi:hypothetical protein
VAVLGFRDRGVCGARSDQLFSIHVQAFPTLFLLYKGRVMASHVGQR